MSIIERAVTNLRTSTREHSKDSPPREPIPFNRDALKNAGLLAEAAEERQLADQYRRIKRPILAKLSALAGSRANNAQLCMVTSALAGDGKTFTSINLAVSIARELDYTVLLVDADVTKRHLSQTLGVDQSPGLIDALADKSLDVEMLIQPTDLKGLSILPVGRSHDSETELLGSARMTEVATNLGRWDSQRVVLLDAAPLLMSSEARAIAHIVGQVIMVVRSGATPQRAVRDALLHVAAGTLTGLVLNGSHPAGDAYGTYGQ
jgi:protein-tyrosine kinase